VLLLIGKIVRFFIRPLQLAFVPSSVVGGLLGLLFTSLAAGVQVVDDAVEEARVIPGILINIVFASMFLGTTLPKVRVLWGRARPNFLYGMSVAWAQVRLDGTPVRRQSQRSSHSHLVSRFPYL
jgi:ESS family glutamate:Na+ symporter